MPAEMDQLGTREEAVDKFLRRIFLSVVQLPSSSDGRNDFSFYESRNASIAKGMIIGSSSSSSSSSGIQDGCVDVHDDALGVLERMCAYEKPNDPLLLPDDLKDGTLYNIVKDIIEHTINLHTKKSGNDNNNNTSSRSSSSDSGGMSTADNLRLSMLVDKERIFQSNTSMMTPKPILRGIDNSRDLPFKPKLNEKVHSIVDLEIKEIRISSSEDDDEIDDDNYTINSAASSLHLTKPSSYYAHPYQAELTSLSYNSILKESESKFKERSPIKSPKPPETLVNLQVIDDVESFDAMMNTLLHRKEIAMDLQQHTYRSFGGFTCLMLISTRDEDFIIDTIKLWDNMHKLQLITADPKILKVFHNCENDILCLQRDFGLYIINSFDTYYAVKELKYPTLSLAHQVKVLCGIVLKQKCQMEDWRQRPLNEVMLTYARDSTHYLLYVYDCLTWELWSNKGWQGMTSVLDSSKRACLQRYEKELFNPLGYQKLLRRCRSLGKIIALTEAQVNTIATLWEWRDSVAREKDESVSYIMSNAEMLRIALAIPQDVETLLTEVGPISSFVEECADEIISTIKNNTLSGIALGHSNIGNRSSNEVVGDLLNTPVRKEDQRHITRAMADSPFAPDLGIDRGVLSPTTVGGQGGVTGDSHGSSYSAGILQTPVSNAPRNRIRSPVLEPEEIFRLAGWNTPSPAEAISLSESPLTTEGSAAIPSFSSPPVQSHLQSKGDLKFSSSSAFSAPVSSTVLGNKNIAELFLGNKGIAELSSSTENDMPKSLSEIYEISNRNRKRNKERKKARDGQTSINSSIDEKEFAKAKDATFLSIDNKAEFDTGSVTSASSFDESAYFQAVETASTTPENTLEFVEMLGWLDASEKKNVLENHLRELELAAQSSQDNDHNNSESNGGGFQNNKSSQQGSFNNSNFGGGGGSSYNQINHNQMRRSMDSTGSGGSMKSGGGGRGSYSNAKGKDSNKLSGGGINGGGGRGNSHRSSGGKPGSNTQDGNVRNGAGGGRYKGRKQ